MFNKALTPLFFLGFISIFTAHYQPVAAVQLTLTDGNSSAIYDDNSGAGYYGFNDWQTDSQTLLTETGLFYRVGNTGKAKTLDTLDSSSTVNGNSATVNYTGTGFTIDLDLSLNDSDSTLNQTATINNTSSSTLDFELFSYFDLVTSSGSTGDTVGIDSNSYTATQSGDRNIITTTVTENNTSYTERRGEVDAIDTIEDTLIGIRNDNNSQLDNDISTITETVNPVSFAYQWDYSLGNNESFEVAFNSSNNAVAVPFEFSPGLGLVLSGFFGCSYYFKRKFKSPT